jgi:hypothetical protein
MDEAREGEERRERGVRLGLPAGSNGSGRLHESQTLDSGMKKKVPEGIYRIPAAGDGLSNDKIGPNRIQLCTNTAQNLDLSNFSRMLFF